MNWLIGRCYSLNPNPQFLEIEGRQSAMHVPEKLIYSGQLLRQKIAIGTLLRDFQIALCNPIGA
jgi:hypothetical protein